MHPWGLDATPASRGVQRAGTPISRLLSANDCQLPSPSRGNHSGFMLALADQGAVDWSVQNRVDCWRKGVIYSVDSVKVAVSLCSPNACFPPGQVVQTQATAVFTRQPRLPSNINHFNCPVHSSCHLESFFHQSQSSSMDWVCNPIAQPSLWETTRSS